jgi:pSer/pThr/pTyr-binding forkhead associated (FHA) protein
MRPYRIIVGDRENALFHGEPILGRSNDAAVFVDDVGISRRHSRITIGLKGATLEDLGSKNGTMLNGRPVDGPTVLGNGEVIVLGVTVLKVCIIETVGSTERLPRSDQ